MRGLALVGLLVLAGCGSAPPRPPDPDAAAAAPIGGIDALQGSQVVITALNFLDTAYRPGGNTAADGFDCSGFTRYVLDASLGLPLPRRAEEQARARGWLHVPRSALQPGDLVFFNTLHRRYSHVGIYIGDGRFVHAPRSGARVRIEAVGNPYWSPRYDGARRAAGMAIDGPADLP